MKSQALNIPSKQHFEAYSAVCLATGMEILIHFSWISFFALLKSNFHARARVYITVIIFSLNILYYIH
jgi:hypothetical protein